MHACRWKKQGPIADGGPAGSFDCAGVAAACVVKDFDSRQYFMFYEGFAANGHRSIGVMVSEDGLRGWRRHSEPILTGGEEGTWDEAEVGAPCAVSMAQGRWRLYYSGAVLRSCCFVPHGPRAASVPIACHRYLALVTNQARMIPVYLIVDFKFGGLCISSESVFLPVSLFLWMKTRSGEQV
jgi:hypothetical protein